MRRFGVRGGRRGGDLPVRMPYDWPGCMFWMAVPPYGSVTLTEDNPAHVITWTDTSPSGKWTTGKTGAYSPTNGNDATRPLYRNRNGRNEVYSPSTGILTLSVASAELGGLVSGSDVPWTGLIVATKIADNSLECLSLETGTNYDVFGFYAQGNQYSSERRSTTTAAVRGGTPGTDPHVMIRVFSGTTSTVWSDGQAIWTGEAQDIAAMTVGTLKLYVRNAGYHEIAGWNRALSSSEVAALTESVRKRWGI